MKVMLVTTPIRPAPTSFPPLGTLSIVSYLRRAGINDVEFYNIDGNRPSYEEALAYIINAKPGVLGISAVVSTAYEYTKRLTLDVKKALPDTLIIVGGNMATSAEILLRRTGTDLCALGEGEKTMVHVINRALTTRDPADFADVPGLMLLDGDGKLVNTGYESQLANDEIYDIDLSILDETSDVDLFYPVVEEGTDAYDKFCHDPRALEPHRKGKRLAYLPGAKGCVARCTFCHRWDKGIRYIPPEVIMSRLKGLIERHDIGFIIMGDENFGTDKRWLREFCEGIKPHDVLWRVAGMRVNCITPEYIDLMCDAGCVSIMYGMETGSERMLKVMEKKVKLQDNYDAMEWTVMAKLATVVQLVVGMPGETPETIRETTAFTKWAMSLSADQNPNDTSINYAQALPGTPLYEIARLRGLIGEGADGEEDYLLRISDKDAHDEVTTLNFTDYPALTSQTWRPRMTAEVNYEYVRKFGLNHYRRKLLQDGNYFSVKRADTGYYANPKRLVDTGIVSDTLHDQKQVMELDDATVPSLLTLLRQRKFGLALICYPVHAYLIRHFLIWLVILKNLQNNGIGYTAKLVGEYLAHHGTRLFRPSKAKGEYVSLRKTLADTPRPVAGDTPEMAPLRLGR